MSPEELSTSSSDSPQLTTLLRRLMPVFLGAAGILLMLGGAVINYVQNSQKTAASLKEENMPNTIAGINTVRSVNVEVAGAVERPGVYELPYDSRVKDVLITAGGLVAKADRNYLSKTINLAQRVSDGQKVYIPFIGEVTAGYSGGIGGGSNINRLININTALEAQLDSLPGIGPVTAQKIIASRPYQTVSELLSRKVVNSSVYAKIKDLVTVN